MTRSNIRIWSRTMCSAVIAKYIMAALEFGADRLCRIGESAVLITCKQPLKPSGYYLYRTVVTICTTSSKFSNSTFCPHSVFMCFVWIWKQTAIISLYSINWLVCITETKNVYCALRVGALHIHHSFSSLSYDRSKASSKASSPHSAIQSFLLQMRISSPFLKVIQ